MKILRLAAMTAIVCLGAYLVQGVTATLTSTFGGSAVAQPTEPLCKVAQAIL